MSRYCPITGKQAVTGNKRSHSLRATKRKWNVNLQTYTIEINGVKTRVRLSARGYRTLNKSLKSNKSK